MTFTVTPDLTLPDGSKGMLPAGIYDVAVRNADGEHAVTLGSLAVVDKPMLLETAPNIVCLDQADRTITLTGTTFLTIGDSAPVLQIEGEKVQPKLSVSECDAIAHEGITAQRCAKATATLVKGSVAVGYPKLDVLNPETAACHSEEEVHLQVVPKPTIDHVKPVLGCVAQTKRTFTIEGKGFLELDGALPHVAIGGVDVTVAAANGCSALQAPKAKTCTSLDVTITVGQIAPGLREVTVQNPAPADCTATATGAVLISPPPVIDHVVPPLLCVDDGPREITVKGKDFLVVDAALPSVKVDGVALAAAAIAPMGCSKLAAPTGTTVEACDTLVLEIAQGGIGVGMPDVDVKNPEEYGCSAKQSGLLTVIAGPSITSVAPALVCTADSTTPITIGGKGFVAVKDSSGADVLPTATVGGVDVTVTGVGSCSANKDADGLTYRQCTQLLATIAMGALPAGNLEGQPVVVVKNPAPAGCSATNGDSLVIPPALTITSLEPPSACAGSVGTQIVTIHGTGFLIVDGALPIVTVGGNPQTLSMADFTCSHSFTVPGFNTVQTCEAVKVGIDASAMLANTTLSITITNPAPVTCAAMAATGFQIVGPPAITLPISPNAICSDVAQTLTISGSNFASAAQVLVGTDCSAPTPTNCQAATNVVVNQAGTSLTAAFPGLPQGSLNVTVRNALTCEATQAASLTVYPTPLVFFVDPPATYDGIEIDAKVFTSGLGGASQLQSIELDDGGGSPIALAHTTDPTNVNHIQATIPSALTSDAYDVVVKSTLGMCEGRLTNGVRVAHTLTLTLASIDPKFAAPDEPTAVTIAATGTAFVAVPHVYLSPKTPGSSAAALTAVEVKDAHTLTAVVPAGLAPDTYDLIVVNPVPTSSTPVQVGRLADAVVVTDALHPAPVVTQIVPNTIIAGSTTSMTISGDHFDTVDGVNVTFACQLNNASAPAPTAGSVVVVNAKTITLSANGSGVSDGSICTVTVANVDKVSDLTDNAAAFTYSAISVRNSSGNLHAWTSGTAMQTARRGLGLLASRPTATSRFLHAIGGDDGAGTTLASVESVDVDVYGRLGTTWSTQTTALPEARTELGFTRIGQFLYAVGGSNGTVAKNTTYRAQVLDPLAGPAISGLNAKLGDRNAATPAQPGLPGGLWLYRVAAVYSSLDASNPRGESIGGEVLDVQLPDNPRGIVLSLNWAAISGASGYRIYRTPAKDSGVGTMRLLAAINCDPTSNGTTCDCTANPAQCQLDDKSDAATFADLSKAPLPPGSLGVWAPMPTLKTARSGLAVVAMKHPNGTSHANDWVLYAFGGRDATPAVLDTYEWSIVTVDPTTGAQTMSAWTIGTGKIPGGGKRNLAAWIIDQYDTSLVSSTQVYVFFGFGFGFDSADSALGTIGSGKLDSTSADGDLGTLLSETTTNGTARGAACYGDSGGYLNVFGGESSNGGLQGDKANALVGTGANPPNTTSSWSAPGGGTLTTARSYCATTQESAFYFTAGGRTGAAVATTSVEKTVQ